MQFCVCHLFRPDIRVNFKLEEVEVVVVDVEDGIVGYGGLEDSDGHGRARCSDHRISVLDQVVGVAGRSGRAPVLPTMREEKCPGLSRVPLLDGARC